MKKTIEEIAVEDGRYDARALKFVFEGLAETIESIQSREACEGMPRHITGQELSWGLARAAQKRWGRLASMVLSYWRVKQTRDFGEIVYLMIDYGWMTSQDSDTIDDFNNVFDFRHVFESQDSIDIR